MSGKKAGLDDKVGSIARAAADELKVYEGPLEDGPWEIIFRRPYLGRKSLRWKRQSFESLWLIESLQQGQVEKIKKMKQQ